MNVALVAYNAYHLPLPYLVPSALMVPLPLLLLLLLGNTCYLVPPRDPLWLLDGLPPFRALRARARVAWFTLVNLLLLIVGVPRVLQRLLPHVYFVSYVTCCFC